MKIDTHELAATLMPGAMLGIAGLGLGVVLAGTLSMAEREALAAMLAPRVALLLLGGAVLAIALGALARHAYATCVKHPARLAEAAQALLLHGTTRTPLLPLAVTCGSGARGLAGIAERLADERDALRSDVDIRVREAARNIEQERNRLAALMSELTQSVVVCNLDGRILLYNQSAQQLFRELSGNANPLLIGLGRSIYAAFDRELVTHALDRLQQGLQQAAPQPTAHFVTSSHAGRLLRVQMAPVRDAPASRHPAASLTGFVLMLQDVTREFQEDAERDRLLHSLIEGTSASLHRLQSAMDMLERPGLDAAARVRFTGTVKAELQALADRFRAPGAGGTGRRWPLEDMLGNDLLHAAVAHIESRTPVRASASSGDGAMWLMVDSYSLLQALAALAARLADEIGVERVQLRLHDAGDRIHLDIAWRGTALSTETAMGWESSPMSAAGQAGPLAVRDVVERHGGALWFARERARDEAFFRFALPKASPREPRRASFSLSHADSRPEFYDFDLFHARPATRELQHRRLVDLAYTAFDTETTGLEPARGDEILQIGAARIVNGKVLRHECFEQLVDPGRSIPAAGLSIHGITPAMVAGQPRIATVLAAFHAFAADTVLVAHNAAFDMRFLQMKELASGVHFDHAVLDTLLLSAVVSPQQESHGLEAIAERFGIPVAGRHTALGDALLTADVFLKLIPLLADRGIHTLEQAREAARQTWYARLDY
ncbi:3'-5' exonuclease [Variovorax sp. JS1663]|uniref:3'-5' exonuclease n=1 Tax=Variovorax sp. JS1663 TaxID=1851577 RepID=UPI000B343A94|nr:exonuclease domain-containing protein [Variovorax sp. JS1663]OUM00984.1 DNA polymerase III subunit epsilon [Variovorax sp. JS1663]